MEELVKRLSIPIPTWILRRRIRIRCQIHKNTNKSRIYIDALDPDIPYTIFKSIQLITNGQIEQQFNEEPFIIELSNENLHLVIIINRSITRFDFRIQDSFERHLVDFLPDRIRPKIFF